MNYKINNPEYNNQTIFSTINSLINSSVINKVNILILCVVLAANPLKAAGRYIENDSSKQTNGIKLNEVTVVANKIETLQGLNTTKSIISNQQIELSPITSLESALKQNATIDIRERGTKGVQADLSIRGGSFDQNLIFLNGVNFTDARTGHQSLSLPIDIEIVSKINLLHGLTTPGALTGALNIITGSYDKTFTNAEISSGQYGYQLFRMNGNYVINKTKIFVAASHKRSNGYTTNTDFETDNAFIHLTHSTINIGNFDLQAGYQDKGFGSNGFYSLSNPNQYEHTQTFIGSLGWSKTINRLNISSNVNYKQTYDQYQWVRGTNLNFHRTDDIGASFLTSYRSSFGKTFLGIDYKNNHLLSSGMGYLLSNPVAIPHQSGLFYTKENKRNTSNFYLKHRIKLNSLEAEVNFNEVITPFGNELLWGINLQHQFNPIFKVVANANRNLRMPTFTDLLYNSSIQKSNPDLKMEKATTFDLGAELNIKKLSANVTAFTRKIDNMIDWVKEPNTTIWYSMNYQTMNTTGVEIIANYTLNHFVKNIGFGYNFIQSDRNVGNLLSKYALDYAKHKLSISTNLQITRKLSFNAIGVYWQRNGSYIDGLGATTPYKPYTTIDAQLTWTENQYLIKLTGTNITNTEFYDIGGLRQAGSWINGGVVVKL